MAILELMRKILPKSLKRRVREVLTTAKQPQMVWGYHNCDGSYRPRTRISDTVFFYHKEKINIADNVFIGHYTILDGTGGIEIEEGAQIGVWVGIFTHSSHIAIRIYGNHYQEIPEAQKKGYPIAPVKIGKYSFIGASSKILPASSKILPGVKIGKGVIVAADSTVKEDVPDFMIVSGNPAKITGDTRKLDQRYIRDLKIRQYYEEWQK